MSSEAQKRIWSETFATEAMCLGFLRRTLADWGGQTCSKVRDLAAGIPCNGVLRHDDLPPEILWKCRRCKAQRSVYAGTIFFKSHIPLTIWFGVLWKLYECELAGGAMTVRDVFERFAHGQRGLSDAAKMKALAKMVARVKAEMFRGVCWRGLEFSTGNRVIRFQNGHFIDSISRQSLDGNPSEDWRKVLKAVADGDRRQPLKKSEALLAFTRRYHGRKANHPPVSISETSDGPTNAECSDPAPFNAADSDPLAGDLKLLRQLAEGPPES